jgi:hypothetical protein
MSGEGSVPRRRESEPETRVVEVGLFVAGVWLCARPWPRLPLWVFVAFLLAVYAGNVIGPPPPSARAVAIVGLVSCLLPVWAAWVDRRRASIDCESIAQIPHGPV